MSYNYMPHPDNQLKRSFMQNDNDASDWRLAFQVHCNQTQPGEQVVVVGNTPRLGSWEPHQGVKLVTADEIYPVWHSTESLSVRELLQGLTESQKLEYKFLILNQHDGERWESIEGNRKITLTAAITDRSFTKTQLINESYSQYHEMPLQTLDDLETKELFQVVPQSQQEPENYQNDAMEPLNMQD